MWVNENRQRGQSDVGANTRLSSRICLYESGLSPLRLLRVVPAAVLVPVYRSDGF
jgi:hypothetical protein